MNAVMMSAVCSALKVCVFECIFKFLFFILLERKVKYATAIIAASMLHAEIPHLSVLFFCWAYTKMPPSIRFKHVI